MTQKKKKCKGFLYDSHHCEVWRKWHIYHGTTAEGQEVDVTNNLQGFINFYFYKNTIEFFGLVWCIGNGGKRIAQLNADFLSFWSFTMKWVHCNSVWFVWVHAWYDIKVHVKINSAPVGSLVSFRVYGRTQ